MTSNVTSTSKKGVGNIRLTEPIEFTIRHYDIVCKGNDNSVDYYFIGVFHPVINLMVADGRTEEEAWNQLSANFLWLYNHYKAYRDEELNEEELKVKRWLMDNVEVIE